jgi:hypothetical protein
MGFSQRKSGTLPGGAHGKTYSTTKAGTVSFSLSLQDVVIETSQPTQKTKQQANKQATIENGFASLPSVLHSDLVPLLSPQHLLLQLSNSIPASLFSSTLPSKLLPCKQLFIKITSFERILFCPTRLSPADRSLEFLRG